MGEAGIRPARPIVLGVAAVRVAMITGAERIGPSELSTLRALCSLLMPIIGLAVGVTVSRRQCSGRLGDPGRLAAPAQRGIGGRHESG